jgi:hypothetical protein
MKIQKIDIEIILGSHLIAYKGRIYRTKQDVHMCDKDIEITDSGISEDDYYEMQQEHITALTHKDFT